MTYKSFETKRLFIRPTDIEDSAFILKLLNTPKWLKYIGDRSIKTIKDASVYITNKMLPQLQELGFSNYTVIRKSDGIKIGTCGLYNRNGIDGIDIGFAFLPEYENKGFAYEASNRIIEAAFNDFKLKTLKAITLENNLSSQKLLKKIRFFL